MTRTKWCAVPANNGGNGPTWQWGNELLVGFSQGEAAFDVTGHQTNNDKPFLSYLARSLDGGVTWQVYKPDNYIDGEGLRQDKAIALPEGIDFTSPGFVMRVEGHGYHGNANQQWFYSLDKGARWHGPYTFGLLFDHPELAGKQFTARTSYLINSAADCFLFLSARETGISRSSGLPFR